MLVSSLQLGKKIGNGFFGDVHLGDDPVHGVVAVKVLTQRADETTSEWELRKQGLLKEGQRLALAAHKHVVRIHHIVEANDQILMVMEYCSGGSLQAAYERGPMTLADVRRVATDVTLGLQMLHTRGMLHRDIKPGNLLVANGGLVQLGDFGLVTDNLVLGYGSQAGYADHVAPEVWNGAGTSIRSDVWALGMTLYRLLHGMSWCDEDPSPRTVVSAGGYADKLRWLPHVPKKWRRTIRQMLRDDPGSRYQNASQLISALADLPIQPDWECAVSAEGATWRRRARGRKHIVEWARHNDRVHEWKAWSEPVGVGQKRSLAGSSSKQGLKPTMDGLHRWLCRA